MRALAALALLVLVVGCQAPPAEMTEAERDAIAAAIMDQTDAMISVWDARDWQGVPAFHHPEKTALAWSGTAYDYGSLVDRWETVGATYTGQKTVWTDRKIEVFSPEAAAFQGNFDLTLNREDGNVLNYPRCIWTAVFELHNGEWLQTFASYTWGGYNVVDEG